ncbi:hypothetical protein B566_EDAN018877 [Ephemera danica]|nr:hypothetical protein B566_EDAN018877 [Ephemera danica]
MLSHLKRFHVTVLPKAKATQKSVRKEKPPSQPAAKLTRRRIEESSDESTDENEEQNETRESEDVQTNAQKSKSTSSATKEVREQEPIASTSQESQDGIHVIDYDEEPPMSITTNSLLFNQSYTRLPMSKQQQENLTNLLANMVAIDLLPLSIVNGEGFKKFVMALEPRYKIPVPGTLKSRLVAQCKDICDTIGNRLDDADAVSLTTDAWTSGRTESYIVGTAHYIDKNFELQSEALFAAPMPERHTATNLQIRLESKVDGWDLKEEIIATVHDNARNITAAVKQSSLLGHSSPCACHTLQLSIKKGLLQKDVNEACKKVRRVVTFFKKSTVGKPALKEAAETLHLPCTELTQESEIRWNTTYDSCAGVLKARKAIQLVINDREIVKPPLAKQLEISEDQWDTIEEVMNVLKPLKTVTELFSGETYVTISLVRPVIKSCIDDLTPKDTDSETISQFKEIIQTDLAARFNFIPDEIVEDDAPSIDEGTDDEIEDAIIQNDSERHTGASALPKISNCNINVAQIASFLDPRFKSLSFENEATKIIIINEVKGLLKNLKSQNSQSTSVQATTTTKLDSILGKSKEVLPGLPEIDMFMSEPEIGHNEDPLLWWKINCQKFPEVSRLAKIFLCVPASSVPSERACSTAGNILRAKRLSLLAENAAMLHFIYENSTKRKVAKKKN